MNVRELRSYLKDFDNELEVMIAHQPGWPLAETLAAVVQLEDEDDDEDEASESDTEVVWLVAGGHDWSRSPYAPSAVFEQM